MAKQHDVFEEFESSAERLADFARRNAAWLVGGLLLLLAGVWAVDWWLSAGDAREQEASAALAETRAAYMTAMGADPSSMEPPELANPEAARRIREEYARRFLEVAEAHPRTVSATLARLEALDLEDPPPDATLERLRAILEQTPGRGSLRALVLQRLGLALEETGRFAQAAERYESAGGIASFPLRSFAMADAARCRALAGQPEQALALYDRIQAEFPDWTLPEHHRALRRELRAAAG